MQKEQLEADKKEINDAILEFSGWVDGYVMGANLEIEPNIFSTVKYQLDKYQELLCKKNN